MKLLKELLTGLNRSDEELEDLPDEDLEDLPDEDLEDLPNEEDDLELDQVANKATQDPNKVGLIRTIKGAHLVYKKETEQGTFEELWIYPSGNSMRDELKTRKAIIAGTDIQPTQTTSPDGHQTYVIWSAGNNEMLQIKGLPS